MLVATPGWQGWVIRQVTRSQVNHAVVMVGPNQGVEAAPGGARQVNLSMYDKMLKHWSKLSLSSQQRNDVVAAACAVTGTRYSWIDVICVGLAHLLGVHVPHWVRNRLADPNRLMCSQLVDQVHLEAGVHLFDDGRLPGDVSPGDLFLLLRKVNSTLS